MGRYGKNMRDCCDSVAQRGSNHIRGCTHYREHRQLFIIRMDNDTDSIKLDGSLFNWLTERKLRVTPHECTANGLGSIQTIVECDGNRAGVVMTIDYAEAA